MHGTAVWVQRQDGSAVSMLLCCSPQCHSEHGASTERATHSAPERPRPATPAPGRAPSRGRGSELPSSDFGLQSSEFRVARLAGLSPQYHSKHGASTARAHTAPPERGLRRPQRRLGSGSMESVGEFPSSELAARADCARVLLCLRILHNTAGSRAFTMGRLSPS
jgi:hypothetical protein